ncbi:endonuclease/exonuclease/phosphatase family protein [Microbacterium bovistercoris]|uniref:Endonuclease/exonuclease/phosphatase family protein n=1 Tax=Microbacterium bovistercoris TaxID=2293570 RepID=A0A371NXZ4_9MICO|nr:endonuclease/exonuclease/phosphatase family protein [Microbacterium bovistercoris]REJ07608.1 endonuclease/exonuclease/phosphatase family protein [Microbacterium bovistercoris]
MTRRRIGDAVRQATEQNSRRIGLMVTLPIAAPFALLLVWPQALGLQRAIVIAQLIAFRAPLAVFLAVLAVIAGAVALLRRRWGVAAALALMLGVASMANAAVLLVRGSAHASPAGDLVVMSWNMQGGASTPRSAARIALDHGAEVVVLPETDADAAAEVARLMDDGGRPMAAFTTPQEWIPTSALISERLGEYRLDTSVGTTPVLPSAVLRPIAEGPTIVAAHTAPPLPGSMDEWREGLDWAAARCDEPWTIMAGDFNATVDHFEGLGREGGLLGLCRDAARDSGAAAAGTWPSTQPGWIASPIDHVMAGSKWITAGFRTVGTDGVGSDHLPVIAVLERR